MKEMERERERVIQIRNMKGKDKVRGREGRGRQQAGGRPIIRSWKRYRLVTLGWLDDPRTFGYNDTLWNAGEAPESVLLCVCWRQCVCVRPGGCSRLWPTLPSDASVTPQLSGRELLNLDIYRSAVSSFVAFLRNLVRLVVDYWLAVCSMHFTCN